MNIQDAERRKVANLKSLFALLTRRWFQCVRNPTARHSSTHPPAVAGRRMFRSVQDRLRRLTVAQSNDDTAQK